MSDLQVLTNDRLHNLINETQEALNELKQEVVRREQVQQEHEVMDLDRHMQSAELSLTGIRNFLSFLLEQSKTR